MAMKTLNIILARHEYAQQIARVTNASPLPACVKLDVLRQAIEQMTVLANNELQAALRAAEQAAEPEVKRDE